MPKSDKLPISTEQVVYLIFNSVNVISVTAQTEAEYNINEENTFDTTDVERGTKVGVKNLQMIQILLVEIMTVALKDSQTLLVNLVIEHL